MTLLPGTVLIIWSVDGAFKHVCDGTEVKYRRWSSKISTDFTPCLSKNILLLIGTDKKTK